MFTVRHVELDLIRYVSSNRIHSSLNETNVMHTVKFSGEVNFIPNMCKLFSYFRIFHIFTYLNFLLIYLLLMFSFRHDFINASQCNFLSVTPIINFIYLTDFLWFKNLYSFYRWKIIASECIFISSFIFEYSVIIHLYLHFRTVSL